MQQRSEEWYKARIGKLTASRIDKMLGTKAAREKLKYELVSERLTQQAQDVFVNNAMQWGAEQEKYALEAYKEITRYDVDEVGLIDHPTIDFAAASPDGIVTTYGTGHSGQLEAMDSIIIEIKCPTSSTFIEIATTQEIPRQYQSQMLWQLACTGLKCADFVIYDPRIMVIEKQLIIIPFEPDHSEIKELEEKAIEFLDEVQDMFDKFIGV